MSKIKFLDLFRRNIEGRTLRIDKGNKSYSYFKTECRGQYIMDEDGILVSIDDERKRYLRMKAFHSIDLPKPSQFYFYYLYQ